LKRRARGRHEEEKERGEGSFQHQGPPNPESPNPTRKGGRGCSAAQRSFFILVRRITGRREACQAGDKLIRRRENLLSGTASLSAG
jgi:hypothetical protein